MGMQFYIFMQMHITLLVVYQKQDGDFNQHRKLDSCYI